MSRSPSTPGSAWIGLGVLSLAWGTSFLVTRLALEELPPETIVAGRILVAAITLNGLRLAAGLRLPRDAGTWLRFALFALTGSVVPFSLISWGQIEVETGLAGILLTTSPLFTVAFAHFMVPGERATPRRLLGLSIGLLGMVVLLDPTSLGGLAGGEGRLGQLAILAGSVCYALNTTLVRRSASLHPLVYASGVMLIGAPLALLAAALGGGIAPPAVPDPQGLAAVVWLGLVPTGLATLVHFRVVASAGPSFTSLTAYLVPVVAVLAGALVFGETLTPTSLIAFALLAGGIAVGRGVPLPALSIPSRLRPSIRPSSLRQRTG